MKADVCLLLEGTYPFVQGGVSSWVNHLVRSMPELTFHIEHISPHRGFYSEGRVYDVPDNVLDITEVFLHEYRVLPGDEEHGSLEKIRRFRSLLDDMRVGRSASFEDFVLALDEEHVESQVFDLLQTRESWQVLVDAYRGDADDESFLNYFWTWRYTYLPVINVLAKRVPRCGVYHAVSTGYAGAMAAACRIRHHRPMLLTEHGIYAKERRIEINRAEWITDWDSGEVVAERAAPFFKRFWRRHFDMLSRICYDNADEILTLFAGNREAQIQDGADPRKIRIVPNGVAVERFAACADAREDQPERPYTVALIGRVCPIKDIVTFIYAMRVVIDRVPDAVGRILGPTAEDPEYVRQCRDLIAALDLEGKVTLEGRVNVLEELPKIDVCALTSISEGQPLVILEAGAAAVPTVATDVGSCEELLTGRTVDDRRLGVGGRITPIASPGKTAEALLELYASPTLRRRMGESMQRRVQTLYDQRDMVAAYRALYSDYSSRGDVDPTRDAGYGPKAELPGFEEVLV